MEGLGMVILMSKMKGENYFDVRLFLCSMFDVPSFRFPTRCIMPIFEYACEKCQAEFELLIRHGDKPTCPECGAAQLEKRLSVPAAHAASSHLPISAPPPCGMGGCGRPKCD
jgi:putative FmdB family regulatory protein